MVYLSSQLKIPKTEVQDGGLVDLTSLCLKERKISCQDLHSGHILHRLLNFQIFFKKSNQNWPHGACILSWHPVAVTELLLPAVG